MNFKTTGSAIVDAYLEKTCGILNIHPNTILEISDVMPNGKTIKDMIKGAEMLADIVMHGKGDIILNCDSDQDGMISGAVGYVALLAMNVDPDRLHLLQNSRKYGNGFNQYAVEYLKSKSPGSIDVVVTSDHGSWDEVRYAEIKRFDPNLKLLITDHHLIPEEEPSSLDCFINPQRKGSDPDYVNMSGAVIAMYLMQETAEILRTKGHPVNNEEMLNIIPMGAITTLGDQMSMIDPLNRSIVKIGLDILNASEDPRWKALKTTLGTQLVTDNNLMMKFGPMVNSCGRLDQTSIPILFFRSTDRKEASSVLKHMSTLNSERRKWQEAAFDYITGTYVYKNFDSDTNKSLVVVHHENISGIAGPIASSILNEKEVPIVVLSTNEPDSETLSGSCRSIKGLHIKNVLDSIAEEHPYVFLKFGGHAGAAGIEIFAKHLELFRSEFENKVREAPSDESLDFSLQFPYGVFDMDDMNALRKLAPFGNHWKEPEVSIEVEIETLFPIKRQHVSYELDSGKTTIVAFDFLGFNRKCSTPERVVFTGSMSVKGNRGNEHPSMFIRDIKE